MLGFSFFFFYESVPVETGGANTASAGMRQEGGFQVPAQLNTNSRSIFSLLTPSHTPRFPMFLPRAALGGKPWVRGF